MTRLTFHGAARTVTGSKYLLEADGAKVLVDCGLFQGLKKLRLLNWAKLPFEPSSIDAVVLTHAHIDHIGYLPRFVNGGFSGAIHATPASGQLAELLLFDAARNQERDADYANRKGFSKHKTAQPLYDTTDAMRALKLFRATPRNEWFSPAEPIWCRYHDAGHLLGSAMIEVEIRNRPKPLRLLFSGDVGRYDAPLYYDPAPPPACDVLICESTYGDRDHIPGNLLDELCDVVTDAMRRGGVMLMASFAVGRAQQLIYLLQVLIHQERIPELPIFLDSPMAINATNIYASFAADHDLSEGDLSDRSSVLTGRSVHLARTVAESKRLNDVDGPAVIISSSGMMTGGRILHHLKQRLPDERNTVVIGGFMAAGTRGRKLQEGAETLRIHGRDVPVRCAVTSVSGLSGHAGRSELLRWLEPLPTPQRVFLTHGEESSALAFSERLTALRGWQTTVPTLGETFDLEDLS